MLKLFDKFLFDFQVGTVGRGRAVDNPDQIQGSRDGFRKRAKRVSHDVAKSALRDETGQARSRHGGKQIRVLKPVPR